MTCESSIRNELLDLVPRVGHRFGLSRTVVEHLCYLIRWTKPLDWEDGNRAVVYCTVTTQARECGVTERQIFNREQQIAEAFGLAMSCTSNRRRYGKRDPESGRIVLAYGFELTGLRDHLDAMRSMRRAIEAENEHWRDLKRTLSEIRGRVRSLFHAVLARGQAEALAELEPLFETVGGRIRAQTDASELERRIIAAETLKARLEALLLEGISGAGTEETSAPAEENFRHIHESNNLPSDNKLSVGRRPGTKPLLARLLPLLEAEESARPKKRLSRGECPERPRNRIEAYAGSGFASPEETGAHRVSPRLACRVASDRFREQLPDYPHQTHFADQGGVIEAATGLLEVLGIRSSAWREACELVGAYPAALCLLIADHAEAEGRIASPGGYFRATARKALTGDLHLDRTFLSRLGGVK